MNDIVIVSAARTPVGSFNGVFGAVPAHLLGIAALKAAIERAGLSPEEVDEVILGQILTAAQGQNPARQAARGAGIPDSKTASTRSAAPACGRWPWRRSRFGLARAISCWPAARRA
jgi:acetyl-CoA C-acetyltransferase